VPLQGIEAEDHAVLLHLGGVDLLDGTPVLDIKPYLPYADSIPDATAGYTPAAPKPCLSVRFSARAKAQCNSLDPARYQDLKQLISGLLAQDPRPAYKNSNEPQTYGMRLWELNVRFLVAGGEIIVETIDRITGLTL